MLEIAFTILLVLLAWFWFNSMGAREIAIKQGTSLAERTNLQFLDESVACSRVSLARNHRGHVQLLRTYEFEVSASGGERLSCNLTLLGNQLQSWHIPPYLQAMH
ncbi:MAG: DUF3301 domain-containing protein [Methylophilaceae bacterium]|nr:DUF3301 domain-containing protein [Methyloradius sp.]